MKFFLLDKKHKEGGSLKVVVYLLGDSYYWLLGDRTFLQPRGGTINAL